ncbi:MAG: winged helix-turn-helix domain-containing protein [Candidatus Aenigmatarchaeota archaeon]
MQATLIENNGTGRMAYDSLILDNPKAFSALNSKIAFKIVKALADSPASAIDVSRKLKIHEQKVYYHVRRLERAGIIYTISNEKRHGMIAKIFSVVSPVIAAKLYDKGVEVKDNIHLNVSQDITKFLDPFIKDGLLNAKIVIGAPVPHGPYGATARHDITLFDLGIFFGKILSENNGFNYCLDTHFSDSDLKKFNLILIGNSKTNSVTHKINTHLPIYFDETKDFQITSKLTGHVYNYDYDAVISKTTNPFNEEKSLLVIAGKRSSGLISAVTAIKNHVSEILQGNSKNKGIIAKVVSGIDRDSDGYIDSVKFLE